MTGSGLGSIVDAALAGIPAEGVAIGVAAGELVEFACRGRRAGDQVDRHTAFYGASVTKQIVGLLLARTIVDRIADDRVVHWLPELPDWMASIRLRHLIHHTADLPEVTDPALGVLGATWR